MCIKHSKTLNPKAEEWRPNPQKSPPLLPHQLIPPVPQPLAAPPPPQPEVFAAPPPHKLLSQPELPFYYSNPLQSYYHYGLNTYSVYPEGHPFYYVSTPANMYVRTTAEAAKAVSSGGADDFGSGNEMNHFMEENVKSCEEKNVENLKSPSCPSVHFFKKGFKRFFPPRFQKAQRCAIFEKKPPPPMSSSPPASQRKLEWRRRRTPNPDLKVSRDGCASQSPPSALALPPPPSQKYFSYSSKTTVMIKNIPNQLRRDFMLKFLDGYCKEHSLEYDFFYLLMDFGRRDNLGYAFVNFTNAVAAMKIKEILQGFKWGVVETDRGSITSKKICEITWARIQGKEALIRRFAKTSFNCDSLDFLPVILDPARNGSDPNPPPPVVLGSLHHPGFSNTY